MSHGEDVGASEKEGEILRLVWLWGGGDLQGDGCGCGPSSKKVGARFWRRRHMEKRPHGVGMAGLRKRREIKEPESEFDDGTSQHLLLRGQAPNERLPIEIKNTT